MKDKSMSAGTFLILLTLAAMPFLAGCGDFWEAPTGTGTTTTTTTLTASQTGPTVTLTATVTPSSGSGTPTGSVTFSDASGKLGSAVNLASGVATYTTTSLAAGSYTFTATYSGDSTYATSTSSSQVLAVTAGGTTASSTELVSSSISPALGASVTFTATVTPSTATGTVTFYDGTTSLGTGTLSVLTPDTATYTTTTLALGTHSITASYGGDSTYAESTSSAVTVNVTGATPSTTTIQPLASNPIAGDSATLIATVAPTTGTGTPTGTVTLIDNTNATPVSIGPATLNNSGQAPLSTDYFATAGTYQITAAYSGDSTYTASTSAVVTITVNAAIPATACGYQDSTNSVEATAVDAYSSGTNTLSGADATIQVSAADESAICAENSGTTLTVISPAITSSSVGSNSSDSSYYGTNAAVLAYGSSSSSGTSITIPAGGSIATSSQYGNGVFASGNGATISLDGVSVTTSGANAHGADAAEGGTLNLTNVSATTSGQNSPAIATDQGGGTVTVSDGIFTAQNAEAVVVDGAGSINLKGTTLSGSLGNDRGILLYQSASSAGATSFTMTGTGSSISYNCNAATTASCANGDSTTGQNKPATLFAIANTAATISLTDVTVINNTGTAADPSGTLLTAQALAPWGASNGGSVTFTGLGENLTGDVIVDQYSSVALTLNEDTSSTGSTLSGAINNAGSAGTVSLTLDSASSWTVTATSNLANLTDPAISGTAVSNIDGGGHCVFYGTVNGTSGTIYILSGTNGGYLAPAGTPTSGAGITCN
ncbi:MAG: beta strand repeat-containing protein [Terracidiphilus sp.]